MVESICNTGEYYIQIDKSTAEKMGFPINEALEQQNFGSY